MSSPEEGELEDDITTSITSYAAPVNNYRMLGQKSVAQGGASGSGVSSYRSRARPVNSSSESGSEGEEDTPLWRQKQEKYFRKSQNKAQCPSSTPPGFSKKGGTRPSSTTSDTNKKRYNVWGSVLQEQDLTQALTKDTNLSMSKDVNYFERTVESYDFTNKYKDDRPDLDEDALDNEQSKETHDPFQKVLKSSSHSLQGREVIGYEDTLYGGDDKTKSRKRKARFGDSDGKSGVHERLGAKKVATMRVGEWIVNEDMEIGELARRIAEYIHEPKVELIERIAEHMGKAAAIKILNQTRDVEDGGGMLTNDGSRRRTPGGVYLQLLKQQEGYNKDMYKLIFVEDNEWKTQQKQRKKQRQRAKRKSCKNEGSNNRSRSSSAEKPGNNSAEMDMDADAQHQKHTSASGQQMDCGEKSEQDRKPRKSRSHSQSVERGETRTSRDDERENFKPKSQRSKSFSVYKDPDAAKNDDEEDSSFNSSTSSTRRSGEFDFQRELEETKNLLAKKKQELLNKDSREMEEEADIDDELDAANVVDIPLDG